MPRLVMLPAPTAKLVTSFVIQIVQLDFSSAFIVTKDEIVVLVVVPLC